MRRIHATLLAAGLTLGGSAHGTGTINPGGATIETGTASSKGQVIFDNCVTQGPFGTRPDPVTVPPVVIETQTLAAPAAPNLGAGGLGAFSASSNMTLAAGTYEFTDYTVSNDAVITYQGPVTIRATGTVLLEGTVETTAASASVAIHCDTFLMPSPTSGIATRGVRTTGGSSDTEVLAVTRVSISSSPAFDVHRIESVDGNVTLGVTDTVLRTGAGISGCDFLAPNGAIDLLSAGPVVLSDTIVTALGPVQVVAHETPSGNGRAVLLSRASRIQVDPGLDILVESESGDVEFTDSSRLEGGGGDVSILALAGEVRIRESAAVSLASGSVGIDATERVEFDHGGNVSATGAQVVVRSETQDVLLRDSTFDDGGPSSISGNLIQIEGGGSVGVEIEGTSGVLGTGITLFAPAGEIFAANLAAPDIAVVASGAVHTAGNIDGILIRVHSADQVSIGGTFCAEDHINILAEGRVEVTGTLKTAVGDHDYRSRFGDIAFVSATVTTEDTGDMQGSGGIFVSSFDPNGTVSVDSGTLIRTGDSEDTSGDIVLRVFIEAPPTGPTPIDAFLAPRSVRARLNTKKPEKSFITISGTLDLGTLGTLAEGPCTFDVGSVNLTGTLTPKGRTFRLVTDDAKLRLVPQKAGGSKARLGFRLKRDLSTVVTSGGQALALRFTNGAIDATAHVALTEFKFKQGRNPGALGAPNLFPVSCRARVKGDGKDSLTLKVAFESGGATPTTAPDVTVTFGDTYSVTIPGAEFSGPTRNRFSARRPDAAPAVSRATLDYGRETLSISIRGVDLGAFPAGATVPVTIELALGSDERAVNVVLARKGSNLTY